MSRVTGNKHALSWISLQPQALPWESCHLPDYLLNLWHCHVPGGFLALDLKNLPALASPPQSFPQSAPRDSRTKSLSTRV